MSFAMFFLAQYINMVTVSAVAMRHIWAVGSDRSCPTGSGGSGSW